MDKPRKLRVRKLGVPIHLVEGQLIVRGSNFVPKKGAKVVIKGEKGQVLIGTVDFPFGPVASPYIPVNILEDLDNQLLQKALTKDLYAEKYVKFKQKRRK